MTLDLNKPSFHRSASEPSVVCATYVKKKKTEKKQGEKKNMQEVG